MSTKRFLNIAFGILFFAVPFLFTPKNFELFEFNKMIAVYGLTIVVAGLWTARMVIEGKVVFRLTFWDIPLLLFFISQLLSTVFSIDPHLSIWGYYSRFNGGLLSTICYLLLYWAYVSNISDWDTVLIHLRLLFLSGGLVSLYAILEHFGISPSCVLVYGQFNDACWIQDVKTRVFATLGQPNWLAAWLAGTIPLAWAFGTKNEGNNSKKSYLYFLLSALYFLVVIYTKSRSGFLGILVAEAVFWGSLGLSLKGRINSLLKPFLILNSSFLILALASGTPFTPSLADKIRIETSPPTAQNTQPTPAPTPQPADLEGGTETSAIRLIVWKGAIKIGLGHPILGTGVETFADSYYMYRPIEHNNVSEWDFLYNKAHNEFLNYFANSGLVGLGTYLLLIGSFTVWVVKKELFPGKGDSPADNFFLSGLLAGFISIPVTSFFGFSVVAVQLLFFLFPALTMVIDQSGRAVSHAIPSLVTKHPKIAIVAISLIAANLLYGDLNYWIADTHYAKSSQDFQTNDLTDAFTEVRQAVDLRPDEPVYEDLIAETSAALAVAAKDQNDSELNQALTNLAISYSGFVEKNSPASLQFALDQTKVYYSLADAHPDLSNTYLNLALDSITKATRLAPTHPKTFYNLGLLQIRLDQPDAGVASLNKAIQLKPDYKDPRYALAVYLASQGNYQEAVAQGHYILQRIDPNDITTKNLVATWSAQLKS